MRTLQEQSLYKTAALLDELEVDDVVMEKLAWNMNWVTKPWDWMMSKFRGGSPAQAATTAAPVAAQAANKQPSFFSNYFSNFFRSPLKDLEQGFYQRNIAKPTLNYFEKNKGPLTPEQLALYNNAINASNVGTRNIIKGVGKIGVGGAGVYGGGQMLFGGSSQPPQQYPY